MRLLLSFIFSILVVSSVSAQWTDIGSFPKKQPRHMDFPSQNVGYTIMDDSGTAATKFYKTINAGQAFQEVPWTDTLLESADIGDIQFISNTTGFIAFRTFTSQGLEAKILRTTTSGQSWTDVSPKNMILGNGWMGVHFLNLDTGFAFSGRLLYRTYNGGQSWDTSAFHLYGGPKAFDFNEKGEGIMGGWDGTFLYRGFIYSTTDYGNTWDTLTLHEQGSHVQDVMLTKEDLAVVLSAGNWGQVPILFFSDDFGQNWDSISISFLRDSLDQIGDFFFADRQRGYLSTYNGYIYKTENGGQSWIMDHKDRTHLNVMAHNGTTLFCTGAVNTLLTKTLLISVRDYTDQSQLKIYPNPVKEILFIENATDIQRISLYDINGRLVKQLNPLGRKVELPVESLEDGVYLIQMNTAEGLISKRFVKSR